MIHEITDRGSKEGRAGGHFPRGKKDIEFSLGEENLKSLVASLRITGIHEFSIVRLVFFMFVFSRYFHSF